MYQLIYHLLSFLITWAITGNPVDVFQKNMFWKSWGRRRIRKTTPHPDSTHSSDAFEGGSRYNNLFGSPASATSGQKITGTFQTFEPFADHNVHANILKEGYTLKIYQMRTYTQKKNGQGGTKLYF